MWNKVKLRKKQVLTIAVALLAAMTTRSQDNHYSWMQYGSRNAILYNSGISRFEDQSAVIINPATLAEAQSSSFNFNTNMVGFNNIRFKDGLGQGFTIQSNNLQVLPSMASGVFKPQKARKDLVIGYALYHSNTDNLNFSDRSERRVNLVNEIESPGEENYLAQYNLNNELDEFTAVIGAGWKPSKNLTLGVSQSFLYRSVESRESFAAYVIADPAANASVDLVGSNLDYYVKYNSLMAFTKLGLTLKAGKWDLGLVFTTPTIGIFGSGKILADLSLTNYRIGTDPSVPRKNLLANGQIEDVKAKYKYPMNLSLGASRSFGNVRMYGAVTWHSSLNYYKVMDPGNASFVQPPDASNVLLTSKALSVWSSNRNVVNASIAADWALKNSNHILFSFRNDQHYAEFDQSADGNNLSKKIWNNWHFTVGNQRQFKSSALIIGLRFNYGINKEFYQPASFEDPSEGNLLQGERGTGTVSSSGIQLLLSYSFTLGNKAAK